MRPYSVSPPGAGWERSGGLSSACSLELVTEAGSCERIESPAPKAPVWIACPERKSETRGVITNKRSAFTANLQRHGISISSTKLNLFLETSINSTATCVFSRYNFKCPDKENNVTKSYLSAAAWTLAILTALLSPARTSAEHEHSSNSGSHQDEPWLRHQKHQQEQQQSLLRRQQRESELKTQEEQAHRAQEAARAAERAARAQQEEKNRIAREAAQNALATSRMQQEQKDRQAKESAQKAQRAAHMQRERRDRLAEEAARNAHIQQEIKDNQAKEAARNAHIQQEIKDHQAKEAAENAFEQSERVRKEQAHRAAHDGRVRQAEAIEQQKLAIERQKETQEQQLKQQANFAAQPFAQGVVRPFQPPPVGPHTIPLDKAMMMPALEEGITAEEREHAIQVENNLRRHLLALQVPPATFSQVQSNVLNRFLSNYQTNIMGQAVNFNPQDTYVSAIPSYEYPAWWHPSPGWIFANGFTLGGLINVGMDWLRWGWHPYYGPPPEGFICAADYVPTPAIYYPAYGLWRIAGVNGWASAGPGAEYTGPISVEILEHRKITVQDPFSGQNVNRLVNVPYLYNAFYFPEFQRWGFMNRHGNFVLLSI